MTTHPGARRGAPPESRKVTTTMPPSPPPTTEPSTAPPADRSTGSVLRELTPVDLTRLQSLNGYPMVSVLLPTTPGARLAPAETKALGQLLDRAEQRLAIELPTPEVDDVIGPLRRLASRVIDRSSPGSGLALFCGAGVVEAYHLPLGPAPRVVIDPTFATRDLARAVLENPPYRLLALASGTARLYLGTGVHVRERAGHGFPIDARPTTDAADRRGHLHQSERTHHDARRWDAFLRDVDHALNGDHRTRALPLILAAAEPLASRYRNRTAQSIVGTIPGNHQRTTPARLSTLARPFIDAHLAQQRHQALDELDEATNRRRAVWGINDVWRAAQDGRVVLLVVDPDFTYPARPAPDGRSLTPASDPEHPAVIDDAVDEIIEAVSIRGGRACFSPLPPAHRGIAAVLSTR
jgi:hypothetical protein